MKRRYGVLIITKPSGEAVDETAWTDDDGQPFTHETAQAQAAFARLHGYTAALASEPA